MIFFRGQKQIIIFIFESHCSYVAIHILKGKGEEGMGLSILSISATLPIHHAGTQKWEIWEEVERGLR